MGTYNSSSSLLVHGNPAFKHARHWSAHSTGQTWQRDALGAGTNVDGLLHLLEGRLRCGSLLLAATHGEHGEPYRATDGPEGEIFVFDGTAKDYAV